VSTFKTRAARWIRRATLLSLLAGVMALGGPWVAIGAASNAGGADKPRPMTFGDCKNENAGVHNGYDCEPEEEPTSAEGLPT
jgi:hypothetical protein